MDSDLVKLTLTKKELNFLETIFAFYMDNQQIDEVIEANELWRKLLDQFLKQTGETELADKNSHIKESKHKIK
jgi:hypothetical protein